MKSGTWLALWSHQTLTRAKHQQTWLIINQPHPLPHANTKSTYSVSSIMRKTVSGLKGRDTMHFCYPQGVYSQVGDLRYIHNIKNNNSHVQYRTFYISQSTFMLISPSITGLFHFTNEETEAQPPGSDPVAFPWQQSC